MAGPFLNTTDPTTFTSALLVGDATGNSLVPPTLSTVAGVPVSACLELQSTLGALLVPRMTTAQVAAITTVSNGMVIYNTTTNVFQFYENGGWVNFAQGGGGGAVTGPVASTNNAVALWNGVGGNVLENSVVIISALGAVTGIISLANGAGTAAAPSYTFAADTTSGMYQSGAGDVDFSSSGLRVLNLTATAAAVNYLNINAGATGFPVAFTAIGTDANIGIELITKGNGPVIFPDGTAAAPAIVFTGDLASGLYDSAVGVVGVSCLSTTIALFSAKGIGLATAAPTNAATNVISIPNGTAPTGMGASSVGIYSSTQPVTTGGGNCRTLSIYTDVTPISTNTITTANLTRTLVISVNGVAYYVPCSTAST
jgi:hypothetical protein